MYKYTCKQVNKHTYIHVSLYVCLKCADMMSMVAIYTCTKWAVTRHTVRTHSTMTYAV